MKKKVLPLGNVNEQSEVFTRRLVGQAPVDPRPDRAVEDGRKVDIHVKTVGPTRPGAKTVHVVQDKILAL